VIYDSLHATLHGNPDFIAVRHEDLSLHPVDGFQTLYNSLGLDFTRRVEKMILTSSSSENPAEPSRNNIYSVKLDSRANITNWKNRLSEDEIQRIRTITKGVSSLYYSDAEW
jgi:hypothetical protein